MKLPVEKGRKKTLINSTSLFLEALDAEETFFLKKQKNMETKRTTFVTYNGSAVCLLLFFLPSGRWQVLYMAADADIMPFWRSS